MKNFKKVSFIILILCLGVGVTPGVKPVFAQNRNVDAIDFTSQSTTIFGLGSRISHEGSEMLLPFRQNGKLHLALIDCIEIALKRNLDIHLVEESLAQADADITRAWSAMLPFIGAEASYTRLDEELAFEVGPVPDPLCLYVKAQRCLHK